MPIDKNGWLNQLLPYVVEKVHDRVIDGECDRYVEDYPRQPRHCALVEREGPLRLPGLDETVPGVLVLGCLETLHSSFDHVDWCVAEYWCSTFN